MMLDYNLVLSDAQAITVTATSTNILDMVATGFAHNDELWAQWLVDTVFAGTAGTTLDLSIQIAQDSAFATVITLLLGSVTHVSVSLGLAAGYVFSYKLPPAIRRAGYRYLRGYYGVTGGYSAGKIDLRLVMIS